MRDLDILEKEAVEAAIASQWDAAVAFNKKIVRLDPYNLGAYLRLGFANIQKQSFDEAKRFYRKALKVQPGNQLATENLEKLTFLASRGGKKKTLRALTFNPDLFLETPGKTKSVILVNLGQKNVLAHLAVGQQVHIKPKRRRLELRAESGEYVGSIPDDLSKRILYFIKAGSVYTAYIKEVSLTRGVIFIREEKKGKRVMRFTSFPKNIQVDMTRVEAAGHEEGEPEDGDDLLTSDIDRLAENLTSDDKEYHLPYSRKQEEDDENAEE